jgi:hypothetical protein
MICDLPSAGVLRCSVLWIGKGAPALWLSRADSGASGPKTTLRHAEALEEIIQESDPYRTRQQMSLVDVNNLVIIVYFFESYMINLSKLRTFTEE